jgi:hypothetical protein
VKYFTILQFATVGGRLGNQIGIKIPYKQTLMQGGVAMRKALITIFNLLLLGMPALAGASEGLDIPEELGKKVDLTNLSGISLFFGKWYNENLWVYAILVTVLMGLLGLCIALVTDIILKMVGMEVSKIEHHE